jgi:quinoprotein glucose dehydrogenase
MFRWTRKLLAVMPVAGLCLTLTLAVPPDANTTKVTPNVDADKARSAISVPAGMKAEVWAAEPLLMNPVAFTFDEQGRAYVCETTRFDKGVPDTRGHMYWLDEDIGTRTVEDRLKMYEKHKYGAKDNNYEGYDDQLRMVWDSTGKGKADKSTVFSKGYNKLKDGLMAGVLARQGSVYATCIPDLYRLQDKDGDGVAEVKESLITGFGLRAQFLGHDLHGLVMGPDGKLYFSIGDRGTNATDAGKKNVFLPDEGAVFRCDWDGKNLEVVHRGLRNPQELAFDDYGNLFTYDNNCDSGDRARWVQIVEGGDSGWRCGYQYGTLMHTPAVPQANRGPWNTEKIWHTQHADSVAYVLPPLAHFGNGPAGLTHYPGIGLNDKYKDHFFACDFTASPGGSIIHAVKVTPKGASFEVKHEPFIKQMVPTDCEFGPDGAFYFSDWTGGWNPPMKGRIFKVTDAEAMKNPAVAEAQKLIAEGFKKKTVEELAKLLAHPHQKVRLEAQYELAGREAYKTLRSVASDSKAPEVARIHAVWSMRYWGVRELIELANNATGHLQLAALRQLARIPATDNIVDLNFKKLFAHEDSAVVAATCAAWARTIATPVVVTRTSDDAYKPLFDVLKSNADKDVYLRQAAVQGLVTMTKNPGDLYTAWEGMKKDYDTNAVRLGVVLALRRMESDKLDVFLNDTEPKIAAEAARAIHDQNLMKPMEALAKLTTNSNSDDGITFRMLSANFKLGTAEHADRLAKFAADVSAKDYLRAAALKLLADWAKPSKRDHITGCKQELPDRDAVVAVTALKPVLSKIFVGSSVVRAEAAATAKKLGLSDAGPLLLATVTDAKQPVNLRVDALYALDDLKAKELDAALAASANDTADKLRGAVNVVTARKDPKQAAKKLPELLMDTKASTIEKQMAFEALGKLPESKEADAALAEWLQFYKAGKVKAELQLDLLDAAKARVENNKLKLQAPLKELLKEIDTAARAAEAKDPLSRNRETLLGGDAEKGREIVVNNAAVYCLRCHKLDGQGGEVGPPLNGVAFEKNADYLLESILLPSKQIAKGYESIQLVLADGSSVSGVLKSRTKDEIVIATAEAKIVKVKTADVDGEKPDKSAMPEDLYKKMSKKEMRDVLAYLATLKTPVK